MPSKRLNWILFLVRWDSGAFSTGIRDQIISVSGQLSARNYRPVPQYYNFMVALNNFVDFRKDNKFTSNWLNGLK